MRTLTTALVLVALASTAWAQSAPGFLHDASDSLQHAWSQPRTYRFQEVQNGTSLTLTVKWRMLSGTAQVSAPGGGMSFGEIEGTWPNFGRTQLQDWVIVNPAGCVLTGTHNASTNTWRVHASAKCQPFQGAGVSFEGTYKLATR